MNDKLHLHFFLVLIFSDFLLSTVYCITFLNISHFFTLFQSNHSCNISCKHTANMFYVCVCVITVIPFESYLPHIFIFIMTHLCIYDKQLHRQSLVAYDGGYKRLQLHIPKKM